MNKKLYIFDLDGTLLNSIYAIANSVNKTLKLYNLKEYEESEFVNFVGNGLRELVNIIFEKENYDLNRDDFVNNLISIYNKEYGYMLKSYDGIKELLNYLDNNNIYYAIITNKDENLAKKSISASDLKNYNFTDIIGLDPNNINEKKPNPINIERLKKKFNLKNEEILFIGDMIVDYNTALNANIDFVYCNWGFGNLKKEENVDNEFKVDTIYEIIERYGNNNVYK